MINKRISDLSCNKEEFNKVKSVHESALKDSGHFSSMSYNNGNSQNARRNRKRKVIWFNPPHSQNVKTNIGNLFIRLVRKHFPKNSKYHKIFNPSTLKLSYCCTTNVGNIIKQLNSKCWTKHDNIHRKCNCRSKPNYPLNGECLAQCLIYKATSETSSNRLIYYGTSEGEFKSRCNNHTKFFRHRECINETELSKQMWNLGDHSLDNNLSWEIHKKASPMWLKTLRSLFVGKSYHHLCWSRHFTKQKNWTDFQMSSQKYIFVGQS